MAVLRPFRFWVQNVLPQVYDDSLSYYELLNKVVAYLNDTIGEVNRIEDYLSGLDITDDVAEILDKWAEDGTLGDIMANWAGLSQFVQDKDVRDKYKKMVVDTFVSYISEFSFNPCLSGSPKHSGELNVVQKYNEYRGYNYLLTNTPSVFTDHVDDIETVDGVDYHVLYSDCTTFASLITKGIKYTDSPYYAGFLDASTPLNTLIAKALDTRGDRPYSFDVMNKWVSFSSVLDASGGKYKQLCMVTGNDRVVDTAVADMLETGDLLFFGNSLNVGNSSMYGMHHIAVFVKTLDEINESTELGAGQRIVPLNGATSDKGYFFHCSTPPAGSPTYSGGIRLEPLENAYGYDSNKGAAWYGVWVIRPMANMMNSAKAFNKATGFFPYRDYWVGKTSGDRDIIFNTGDGNIQANDLDVHNITANRLDAAMVRQRGIQVDNGSDCNEFFSNGVYRNNRPSFSVAHSPNADIFFVIENIGFGNVSDAVNPWQGYQRWTSVDSTTGNISLFIRVYRHRIGVEDIWSEWRQITLV